MPEGLGLEQAGVLPLVTTTGGQLIEHVAPRRGDWILVTGALGSVGRTAVYAAKELGARVIAGVRQEQKSAAEELGVDEVVAVDDEREIASLPQLDVIADTVGHEVVERLILKLKPNGVLGSVLGKPRAAEGRPIRVEAFTAQPDAALLRRMAEAVRKGKLQIPMAKRFRLSEVREAQALAERGGLDGKIALVP